MKCPHCGAEIINTDICDYCGSQIDARMRKEQEQLSKSGCPSCGSTNISFSREFEGEDRDSNSRRAIYRTVGVCRDCGRTWYTDSGKPEKKRRTWLWVLGWIFLFPVPVTILVARKKNLNTVLKVFLILLAWFAFFAFAYMGNNSEEVNTPGTEYTRSADESDAEIGTQEAENIAETASDNQTDETKSETETEATDKNRKPTLGETNAYREASEYSDMMHTSEEAIRDHLNFYGFTREEADYAIAKCNLDFKKECLINTRQYAEMMNASEQGIRDHLKYEKFTSEEVEYALKECNYNFSEVCFTNAKQYMEMMNSSEKALREHLQYEKFTDDQIDYALKKLGF